MMKKKLFAAVGLALAFAGCGDDVTKTTDVEETVGIAQLAKGEEFPNCDSSTAGGMLYAADSGKVFYCLPGDGGYSWTALDGTPGGSVDTVIVKDSLLQTDTLEIPIKGGYDTLVFRDTLLISHLDSLVDLDGKSCAAEMLADSSGYKIVCGGDSVGVVRSGAKGLQGETGATGTSGEDGEGCTVADSGNGVVLVQCAADTVKLYKAVCGTVPYEPTKKFCSDGKLYSCNEKPYDPLKDFCYTGGAKDSIVPLCGGKSYDLSTSFCYDDGIVSLCGGKSYDLGESFCYDDGIVSLCGGKSYNLGESFCYTGGAKDSIVPLCGGQSYDLGNSFCGNDGAEDLIVALCGGKSYDLGESFCYTRGLKDSIIALCNGEFYDPSKRFCYNDGTKDSIVALCGGQSYNLGNSFCGNDGTKDSIVAFCGGQSYNVASQFCVSNQLYKMTTIGTQTWMAENLKMVYYGSGKDLWYCYNDDKDNCEKYGYLYLWSAAVDSLGRFTNNAKGCGDGIAYGERFGYDEDHTCTPATTVRGICPEGWHLPTYADFNTLIDFVGCSSSSCTELMATSVTNGTDDYGFSALMVGMGDVERDYYFGLDARTCFWASTAGADQAYWLQLWKNNTIALESRSKAYLCSVRCIKD